LPLAAAVLVRVAVFSGRGQPYAIQHLGDAASSLVAPTDALNG